MTAATTSIVSVGALSARVNVPLSRVLRAVEILGIRPAMEIDEIAYLDQDDAQRVAEHLVAKRDGTAKTTIPENE
jgi:hypothetical protein